MPEDAPRKKTHRGAAPKKPAKKASAWRSATGAASYKPDAPKKPTDKKAAAKKHAAKPATAAKPAGGAAKPAARPAASGRPAGGAGKPAARPAKPAARGAAYGKPASLPAKPATRAGAPGKPASRSARPATGGSRSDGPSRTGAAPSRTPARPAGSSSPRPRSDAASTRAPRSDAPPSRAPRSDVPASRAPRRDAPTDRPRRSDGPPARTPRSDAPASWAPRGDGPPRTPRSDGPGERPRRTSAPGDRPSYAPRAPRTGTPAGRGRPSTGPRSDDRPRVPRERAPERPAGPALPPDADPRLLPSEIRRELRSLQDATADRVAAHLVAAGQLVDEDPAAAYEHAKAAKALAARIGAVREASGVTAYRAGDFAGALTDLKAARRITGLPDHLPLLADCERALGKPDRALALANDPERTRLDRAQQVELAIVASGARRDLGQADAAVLALQGPELDSDAVEPWTVRLWYAYADALLAAGRRDEAESWFTAAATIDEDGETDAEERLAELSRRAGE